MNEKIERINAFLNAIEEKNGIEDVMSFRLMAGGRKNDRRKLNQSCVNDRRKNCLRTVNRKCTNSGKCNDSINEICKSP